MTKDDLTNGMVVVTRNGNKYIVCRTDEMFKLLGLSHMMDEWKIKDDLSNIENKDFDIVLVQKIIPNINGSILNLFEDAKHCCFFFWERKEVKEMTVAEISEALGYEVKVVK